MNEESSTRKCPRCGNAIAADSPEGLCPSCLMALNFTTQTEIAGEAPGPAGTKRVPQTPPAPAREAVAKLFPQLEILELLGQGGMGAVYKARQPKLDRWVALKIVLRPADDGRTGQAFGERFAREARALARLNHPAIVAVHEYGEAGGYPYLLMEFVDGLTLRQLLRQGKLTPEEALAIVPKICEALQFAHQRGIVHRDVKPENILLDKEGQVKIADFGIAKILAPGAQDMSLTGGRDVVGTPHYMAPEQVEQPAKVDHRADIFSLGVVFYEMLTGELPLGKFQPPSKKVHVDVRLDEVVLRALEKEPERRYQHASDVKKEVETIAGSASAGTPTSSPAPEDHGEWRRHFHAIPKWAMFLSLGLLAAIGLQWGSRMLQRAPAQKSTTQYNGVGQASGRVDVVPGEGTRPAAKSDSNGIISNLVAAENWSEMMRLFPLATRRTDKANAIEGAIQTNTPILLEWDMSLPMAFVTGMEKRPMPELKPGSRLEFAPDDQTRVILRHDPWPHAAWRFHLEILDDAGAAIQKVEHTIESTGRRPPKRQWTVEQSSFISALGSGVLDRGKRFRLSVETLWVEQEGEFQFDVDLPLYFGLSTTDYTGMFRAESLKVDATNHEAVVRARVAEWPKSKWNLRLELLNGEGQSLSEHRGIAENGGWIISNVATGEREFRFPVKHLAKEAQTPQRFRLRIEAATSSPP